MNTKPILALLTCLLLTSLCGLRAQEATGVSLLEFDGKMAIFAVDATATKSGDVTRAALTRLFTVLLDEGVDGINQGRKMMTVDKPQWREKFFKEKDPPYMLYVRGIQSEGEPIKTTVGEYRATVLLKINIEYLLRQLKNAGCRTDD